MRLNLTPPETDFEEDPRYAVANREALWGLSYWVLFTLVVSLTAWLLGGGRSADELTFVLGFPRWFFWSCLVATTALAVLPALLVRRFFTEVPLGADAHPADEEA